MNVKRPTFKPQRKCIDFYVVFLGHHHANALMTFKVAENDVCSQDPVDIVVVNNKVEQ